MNAGNRASERIKMLHNNVSKCGSVEEDMFQMCDSVQNELLSYIQFYLHKATADSIKDTVTRFYGQDEISLAKSILWNSVSDVTIGIEEKRKNTASRTAYEADVSDIVTAFQKLDTKGVILPKFSACDLDRIPKYAPGEMSDSVILDKMAILEQRIQTMEGKTDMNNNSIKSLELRVQQTVLDIDKIKLERPKDIGMGLSEKVWLSLNSKMKDIPLPQRLMKVNREETKTVTPRAGVKSDASPTFGRAETPRSRLLPVIPDNLYRWSASPVRSVVATESSSNGRCQEITGSSHLGRPLVPTDDRQKRMGAEEEIQKRTSKAEELTSVWEITKEERRKIYQKKRRDRQEKETIVGKRNVEAIKSGPKHANLFVSNVRCDVETDCLKKYIQNENVELYEIKQMSSDEAYMKSFKVTIQYEDLEKTTNGDFWPTGIRCRKFYEKKTRP